jgi:hypothetical protein
MVLIDEVCLQLHGPAELSDEDVELAATIVRLLLLPLKADVEAALGDAGVHDVRVRWAQ